MSSPTLDRTTERQFAEAQRKHSQNDLLGALRIYEGLISRGVTSIPVLVYRALALVQLGRDRDARQAADQAASRLGQESQQVAERSTLGIVYRRLGLPQHAEQQLRLAFAADPSNAAVRNNLALVLTQMGRFGEADPLFEQAMIDLPEDAAPALNRARIGLYRQDFEHAEAMLQAAKDRQPGHVDVSLLEAQLALAEANHERAFNCLTKVLGKNPVHPEGWSHLAALESSAIDATKLDEILGTLARAKPSSAKLLATVVGIARKQLVWKHLSAIEKLLDGALEEDSDTVIDSGSMFLLLSASVSQKAHKVGAHGGYEAFIARGRNEERPKALARTGRKLKVGYLSSDLRGHAIGFLFAGVMEAHQHDDIEWYAYVNWKDDGSEMRQRFRKSFDRFVNITELSDEDAAARIREDGIDVLVDLNQVTAGNRVGLFAYGPAPVTVQWLGMPGTIGAGKRVDYILMDAWTAHPGNLDGFDEQPVLLAGSYQPNDWKKPDLGLAKTRADWKLPETAPVLCSFNQTQKFSPDTVDLWAQILLRVPEAVLWVLAGEPAIEERFLRIFNEAGIAKDRILFAERAGHDVHLARLSHADLMLDNWPYNAHTTCSDALRAGTAVLTLPGRTFASRVAAGILETANMADWIASSPEDYVDKAVAYIQQDYAARQALKQQVHATYWASPMVDCGGFARRLESFYEAALARALDGKAPAPHWVDWQGGVHEGLPAADAWRQTVYRRGEVDAVTTVSAAAAIDSPSSTPSNNAETVSATAAATPSAIRRGSRDARLHNLRILKERVLSLSHAPLCIDVGAKPEDKKAWDVLADQGLATLVGFDPQCTDEQGSGYRRIIGAALGDGATHNLNLAKVSGMTSLLEPDMAWLSRFPKFAEWGEVMSTETMATRRADDLSELDGARFIKIDTQGSEKMILENAPQLLNDALTLIELELSPVPLYKGEPSLFEVGYWLQQQGWVLHTWVNVNRRMLKPLAEDSNPYEALKQVFQTDVVFMPHPDRWSGFTPERLLSLAFLAHAIYGSHDVAALALQTLDEKGAQAPRLPQYRRYLQEAGLDA
jgi:predicted O-linked N-acetylglucosamine transferase (SPINDLY family)